MPDPVVVSIATFVTGGAFGSIFSKLWDRNATKRDVIFKEKKDLYLAYVDASISVMKEVGNAYVACTNAIYHRKTEKDLSHEVADAHKVTAVAERIGLFAPESVNEYCSLVNGLMSHLIVLVISARDQHAALVDAEFSEEALSEVSQRLVVCSANFKIWQARFYLQLARIKIAMREDLSVYWSSPFREKKLLIDDSTSFMANQITAPMPWIPTSADWESSYRTVFPPVPKVKVIIAGKLTEL